MKEERKRKMSDNLLSLLMSELRHNHAKLPLIRKSIDHLEASRDEIISRGAFSLITAFQYYLEDEGASKYSPHIFFDYEDGDAEFSLGHRTWEIPGEYAFFLDRNQFVESETVDGKLESHRTVLFVTPKGLEWIEEMDRKDKERAEDE